MASQASSQPETTMSRFSAGLHKGSVIVPNRDHGLRSDAVCRSVRHKIDSSLLAEGMALLPGGLSLRTGWDTPWNPVYSVVKVQERNNTPHIYNYNLKTEKRNPVKKIFYFPDEI